MLNSKTKISIPKENGRYSYFKIYINKTCKRICRINLYKRLDLK